MTVKEYLAPDAEFIEFDNSDVIVASPGDMGGRPSNAEIRACIDNGNGRFCMNLGDSEEACAYLVGWWCDYFTDEILVNAAPANRH